MSHKVRYFVIGEPPLERHKASCKCPWESDRLPSQQEAEDAYLAHLKDVERIRAGLGTKTPSMKSQAAYYRQKADDPQTPEKDRPIWEQLAGELERRLGSRPRYEDQQPLV